MTSQAHWAASRKWQCVVFDLDGTLLDTRKALLQAINARLAMLRRRVVMASEVGAAMHEGMESMLTRALSLTGALPDTVTCDAILRDVSALYLASAPTLIEPFHSVKPLLQLLHAADVRMAVCTNQRETHARELLDRFELSRYFVDLVGGDTFEVRKPHPLPLIWLLGRCAVHPSRALMVGDSELDALCANGAGVDVILMGHGYGGPDVTSAYPSCRDFAVLHQLMQSMLRQRSIEKTKLSLDSGRS